MVGSQGQRSLSIAFAWARCCESAIDAESKPWQVMTPMIEPEPHFDEGLRAANLALSGRKRREVSRITSLELRFTDPRSQPWEALAMISVALLSVLVVVGLWLA